MKFETIRLMLSERDQGDLFSRREDRLASEYMFDSREKWLRSTFSDTIYFQHRTVTFAYVPDKDNSGDLVVGQIGRPRTVRENSPPESGFIPTTREAWKAADFLLDPTSHADGQKVALAEDSTVASPLPLMKSLAAAINARIPPEPYLIEANGITDPETFFQFVRENPNDVTTVSFELVVPNMFGIRTELDEEMRQLRDNEKAKKAKLVLQSQDGLALDTERVRQTAAYTAEGGGNIFARTRSGKRFSSRSKGKSVSVAQLGDAEERPGLIARVIAMVFRQ